MKTSTNAMFSAIALLGFIAATAAMVHEPSIMLGLAMTFTGIGFVGSIHGLAKYFDK